MTREELLIFFKALSDTNRLRIVGLLAERGYSVEELSAVLGLSASTASHHLSRLAEADLVRVQVEGHYRVYRLHESTLESMARRLLSTQQLPRMADDLNRDAYAEKVLRDYLEPEGRLKTIPAQRKKRAVILQYLQAQFEPGIRYREDEVNQILQRFHPDSATLRRELVGAALMERDQSRYWRVGG